MTSISRAKSPTGSVAGSTHGGSSRTHHGGGSEDDGKVKVDYYYGEKHKLRFFLTQLQALFALRRHQYPDPKSQVLYAGLQLRGNAFSWFEPILNDYLKNSDSGREEETKQIFHSFANFDTAIRQVFGVADEERTAERVIHQLQQRGSAAQYWSQFQAVASKLGWEDDALKAIFYAGLKSEVKEKMINNKPSGYRNLVDTAIRIDNEIYELRQNRGSGRYRSGYVSYGGRANYGDPMDLDAMTRGRPSRPYGKGKGRGRGNNAERERRRRDNLCYNCGKSGHRAKECNGKPERLHMMNDESAGMIGQKADTIMNAGETNAKKGASTAQAEKDRLWVLEEEETDTSDPKENNRALEETVARNKENKERWEKEYHTTLSWTACYDNSCTIHYSEKEGLGWFPQGPRNRKYRTKKVPQPSWW